MKLRRNSKQKISFLKELFFRSLFIFSIQILAVGGIYSQNLQYIKVDLSVENATLTQIFNKLDKITDLDFRYSDEIQNESKTFSYDYSDTELKFVLKQIAKDANLEYKVDGGSVSIKKAKKKPISGLVIDASTGEPLIGVTVALKNTTNGTVTDVNGAFKFLAYPTSDLVFSYIGYSNYEIEVGEKSSFEVRLQTSSEEIDEVVVTALGIKRSEKAVGYSTQNIDGEKVTASGNVNVASSLSGKIAGLTILNPTGMFQTPSFSLRGNTPLIVLDGVPIESDFFDLSSDNIESINVLKGTAASALYGSRGKNGAIMISSKTAKKEGLEVSITTKNMVTAGFASFPETQHQYGSGSQGAYEFWDGEGGGKSDDDMTWGPKLDVGNMAPQWNSPIRDKTTGEVTPWWGSVKDTKYDDKSRYERVPLPLVSHDNLNDFLQTGFITNNNISIVYKDEKSSFVLLGQYAYQRGQAPTTALHTGGLNFNSTFNLSRKLTLEANLAYNAVVSPNYPDYGYHPSNYMYTIVEWMGDDVDGKELREHQWVPGMEGYRQANYNYAWYNNPYFAIMQSKRKENRNVLTSLLSLNYEISPGLNVMGRASLRENDNLRQNMIPKSYMNYGDSREGDYKVWNTRQMNVDADVLVTYKKELFSDIRLTVNAGSSIFCRRYRNDYQSTDGLTVPGIYSMTNSTGPIIIFNEDEPTWGQRNKKEIRSVYGSANLDFSKYAYLTITGRNDWSSTIAEGSNSYFYPSVTLSSVISDYLKLPEPINYLKAFGSWTTVSSDLDPYQIQQVYSKLEDWGSTTMVEYFSSLVNYNIKPQKTTSWEFGLSSSLLNRRLSLDLTYYRSLDENQILDMAISQASGFEKRKINGNKYTTNGWEIMTGVKFFQTKNFKWNFNLNWSKRVKRLTSIYGDEEYFGNLKKGDRADAYYNTVWQRSSDGRLIVDATGQPIKDPYKRYLGHTDPNWRLGWQNTFHYKDFSLNINLDGAYGGVIYSTLSPKLWWGGKHVDSTKYRDEEYSTGNPVYVPEAVIVTGGDVTYDIHGNVVSDTRTYSENTQAVDWQSWCQNYPYRAKVSSETDKTFANVFSRSYIKLRHVALSYNFHKLLERENYPIKDLTFTVFGNNLALWSKAPWIDPDISGDDSNDDGAADPSARYIGAGINVKF
jgi:TonB-linked SusC/RagA family outer membrane protein